MGLTDEDFSNGELSVRIPDIQRTGEMLSGMERIDIPVTRPRSNQRLNSFFAEFREDSSIQALMECNAEGNVPVPHCDLVTKTELFEMNVSGFRRDQLGQLDIILRHGENFTACLTWESD